MSINDFINSISPALNLYAGIQGRAQANKSINRGNVPTAAETQQNALYAALADPNSPLLAQMTAQDKASNLDAFQRQLTEMQLADRRAAAMGHAQTFFSPERADENISYLTSRGLPQMDAAARQSAQARILAAASGYGGMVGPQAGRNAVGIQQGVSNAAYGSTLPNRLLDMFRQPNAPLQGPTPSGAPVQPYNAQNPMWSQLPIQYNQMRYPSA